MKQPATPTLTSGEEAVVPPATNEQPRPVDGEQATAPKIPVAKPLRLLLVEDSELDAELVLRRLRVAGYNVIHERVETPDGMKAAVGKHPWDVILSDYTIPQFGGMAAFQVYKQMGLDVPFICVSGTIGEETAVAMMKAGAHDYVLKDNLSRLAPVVERELQAAETRLKKRRAEKEAALSAAIIASATDAIIAKTLEGKILNWNRGAEETYGYTKEEAVGKSMAMLMPPDRPEEYLTLARKLQQGDEIEGFETVRVRKDGEEIDVSLTMSLIKEEDGQVIGVSTMARDITARKQAEEEARRLAELSSANLELRREIEERQRLEKEVLVISERERRRIGQDLHDGLGAHLTGVTFLANALQGRLKRKGLPETDEASRVVELLNQAISQTRKLAWVLNPISLQEQGLMKALDQLAANIHEVYQISCDLTCPRVVMFHDAVGAMNLYRITQESIHNAITHGHATKVSIGLREEKGMIRLSVQGNGLSFPEKPPQGSGMGLKIMASRARTIGASFDIRAGKHGGVLMTCVLPRANLPKKETMPSEMKMPAE